MESIGTPALWFGFAALILCCLALDLGVLSRRAHVVGPREALAWSLTWIGMALAFNVFVYWWLGPQAALEYLTGWLIEKSLSVDNLFVFVLIFSAFGVPRQLHHHVLFWGILGALVMRGIFIGLGAALVQNFHWILYIFGAFLVYTGIRLFAQDYEVSHPDDNRAVRALRRFVPVTEGYEGQSFVVQRNGRRWVTPLMVVLVAIEASDLVFAVDSIPAIFAVTTDPFIIYTSNIFAILGLRALYFLLADMMSRFQYLKHGLGLILTFVGVKMLIADVYEIPIATSLAVISATLALSVVISLIRSRPPDRGAVATRGDVSEDAGDAL